MRWRMKNPPDLAMRWRFADRHCIVFQKEEKKEKEQTL